MVGTGTNDPDPDSVRLVPSCKTVDNVDTISCIEVVNGPFAIDTPNLHMRSKLVVNFTQPHILYPSYRPLCVTYWYKIQLQFKHRFHKQ
jgi:hypothetical protein